MQSMQGGAPNPAAMMALLSRLQGGGGPGGPGGPMMNMAPGPQPGPPPPGPGMQPGPPTVRPGGTEAAEVLISEGKDKLQQALQVFSPGDERTERLANILRDLDSLLANVGRPNEPMPPNLPGVPPPAQPSDV